jgi:hypothetical protein
MATIEITETQDYDLVAKVVEMEKFAPLQSGAAGSATAAAAPRSELVSISMDAR